jgi:hypothetical protein
MMGGLAMLGGLGMLGVRETLGGLLGMEDRP